MKEVLKVCLNLTQRNKAVTKNVLLKTESSQNEWRFIDDEQSFSAY